MKSILFSLYRFLTNRWFRLNGIYIAKTAYISRRGFVRLGKGKLILEEYAQINPHCFLLNFDTIKIGKNSTLAYQVMILTSANPNSPYNRLSELYPPTHAPVVIGDNVWVGARAVILPGVKIGNNVVVAAGSVVTKDIPDNCLVAGVPAIVKKQINL
jgi:maltose O-acetyltransferase